MAQGSPRNFDQSRIQLGLLDWDIVFGRVVAEVGAPVIVVGPVTVVLVETAHYLCCRKFPEVIQWAQLVALFLFSFVLASKAQLSSRIFPPFPNLC